MKKKVNTGDFLANKDFMKGQLPLDVMPVPPDAFLQGGVRYSSLIRWAFALTFARAMELLSNPFQTMEQKAWPFNVLIATFEKTLAPIADDEFKKETRAINHKFRDVYGEFKYWMDAAYGLAHLEAIMKLLSRRGILAAEAVEAIPEVDVDDVAKLLAKTD